MSANAQHHQPLLFQNSVAVILWVAECFQWDSFDFGDFLWWTMADEYRLSTPLERFHAA